MVKQTDIFLSILNGGRLNFKIGDPINKVTEYMGPPNEQIGDLDGGYWSYNLFRVGFNSKQEIDEIGFYFIGNELNVLKIEKNEEIFEIGCHTLLHKFIFFL